MTKNRYMIIIASFVIMSLFAGCAGKNRKQADLTTPPEWTLKESGAFTDDNTVFGVGSVWGIDNPSLARTVANNRARAEIAKYFKIYTASLMKDFQSATIANDKNSSSESQNIEETLKTFSKGTLPGIIIIDHWKNPETGEFFSLAKIDFENIKRSLKNAKNLSEAVRNNILEQAEKAFKNLEQEESKHE